MLMRDFIQNNLRFPARSPVINRAHPLLAGNAIGCVAVANMGGAMTDLNLNVIASNTNTQSKMTEMGPTVNGGNAVNSTTCLTFNGPAGTLSAISASCIIKFTGNGTMFPICLNAANPGLSNGIEITTTTTVINWQEGNLNIFGNYDMKLNHWYYFMAYNRSDTQDGTGYMVVTDLTTGLQEIFSNSTSGLPELAWLATITAIQANDSNTGGPCQIAACHVAGQTPQQPSPNSTQPRMDLGALLEAATKPWSLWYA
jgi:hypothetical protein